MGTTFVSDEEFREEFFRVFGEEDMVRIVFLFDRQMVPGDHAKALFSRMSARKITKYLNFVLFSNREGTANEFMITQLKDVADKVRGMSYSKTLNTYVSGLNSSFRPDMYIQHQALGSVLVTRHAWIRFFERAPKHILQRFVLGTKIDVDSMHQELGKVFSDSVQQTLPPKYEVRRFFNNNKQDAKRFLHKGTDLYFVVVRDGLQHIAVTIETIGDLKS